MLPVADARARLLDLMRPTPPETVSVASAAGRVVAAPIHARLDQPPYAVSAMDGYAVRAADVAACPAHLTVVAATAAGDPPAGAIAGGEAVRIFTGAPVPPGADTIVLQEDTGREGGRVTVHQGRPEGSWVRPAGLDFAEGDAGPPVGRRLTARDVGVIAAMNHPWVRVRRRPRVAVIATGDEVVLPGEPKRSEQIISSNSVALASFVEAQGCDAVNLGIAADTPEALGARLDAAAGCDLVLTIGGASAGDHDHVRSVLDAKGADLAFWKIAMRPGKPLMVARLGGTPVIGLPGNPVSVLVCAHVLVHPALDVLSGGAGDGPPATTAVLGADVGGNGPRRDHMRARLHRDPEGTLVATPFSGQDSAMLRTLADADGLIVRAPHADAAPAGTPVTVLPLDGGDLDRTGGAV